MCVSDVVRRTARAAPAAALGMLLCQLAGALVPVASLWTTRVLVDSLVSGRVGVAVAAVGIQGALGVAGTGFSAVGGYLGTVVNGRLDLAYQKALADVVQVRPYAALELPGFRDTAMRLRMNLVNGPLRMRTSCTGLCGTLVTLLGSSGFLLHTQPLFALGVACSVVPGLWFSNRSSRRRFPLSRRRYRYRGSPATTLAC
jgi:ATP-binding cassette subfamily B protein